ncbi:hypothetical protein FKM82_030487 [Ascaphus truei]
MTSPHRHVEGQSPGHRHDGELNSHIRVRSRRRMCWDLVIVAHKVMYGAMGTQQPTKPSRETETQKLNMDLLRVKSVNRQGCYVIPLQIV